MTLPLTKTIEPDLLKDFLEEKVRLYNTPAFIENDPVSIPHRFNEKQDIEIAAFLTATISWGNRKAILKSADKMLAAMDHAPADFIRQATESEVQSLEKMTVHRTFSGVDFAEFVRNLQQLYKENDSLQPFFKPEKEELNFYHALHRFRCAFLSDSGHRCSKHVSSTYKNASAKRLMMFLRWMVRRDKAGVDFGLWTHISPRLLSVPLDVHTGNISRQLGLLQRKQNDWKAVEEMDHALRRLDPDDPAKYDFALFGLGVSGGL